MKPPLYTQCQEHDIPEGVRFDTPRRNQGQHIEVSYGGFSRAEHDVGDLYKRVIDHTLRGDAAHVTYYRRNDR